MLSQVPIRVIVLTLLAAGLLAAPARAQLGLVTATAGTGEIRDAEGHPRPWGIGSEVDEDTELITEPDSYAMLFFVSGIGAADIDFDGVIVVQVDQNTHVRIRSGPGRRSPIDVHVLRGGVRAFFDAREHGEYILLSTPLGRMRITGSEIYATHDTPRQPGSVFGTFDSPCDVILERDGARRGITELQKIVIAGPQAGLELLDMVAADSRHWEEEFPDLFMHAALASRGRVSTAYAGRAWVGEYVVSAQRLEDVAEEASGNIPTQEPVVTSSPTRALLPALALAVLARQGSQQPRLRSIRQDRLIGDERRVELGPRELRVERDVTLYDRLRLRRDVQFRSRQRQRR